LAAQPTYGYLNEEIWWFLFEAAEDPYHGLVATYLRNPQWQKKAPCGLTVFGQAKLLKWIRKRYRVKDHWLKPVEFSSFFHPLDQLRLLHTHTPALKELAPNAFSDRDQAERLISWLRLESNGLTPKDPDWWQRLESGLEK